MPAQVLFQVGNRQFGLDLQHIKSIHRASAFFEEQSVERSSKTLELDGKEVHLYHLSSIFGEEAPSAELGSKRLILVDAPEGPLALIVDGMDEVIEVTIDQVEPLPPVFKGTARCCFPRVLKQKDHLVLLLSPEGIKKAEWLPQDSKDMSSQPDESGDIQEAGEEITDCPEPMQNSPRHEVSLQERCQSMSLENEKPIPATGLPQIGTSEPEEVAPTIELSQTETREPKTDVTPDETAPEPEVEGVLQTERDPGAGVPDPGTGRHHPDVVKKMTIDPVLSKKIVTYVATRCRKRWREKGCSGLDSAIDPLFNDLAQKVAADPVQLKRIVVRVVEKCKRRWCEAEGREDIK